MNVLSLFDGMSCGQLALNKANIKYNNYFTAEIDKFCIQVTKLNYPDTINLGDVSHIDFSANFPFFDLLLGGSPCQGFSNAGKKLGFKDKRSQYFFDYVRIKNKLKPSWFLYENVKMKKEYENIISKELGVKPIEVNSNLVSAQNRKRLYWTNIFFEIPKDKNILYKDIKEKNVNDKYYYSNKMLDWIHRHSKRKNKKLRIQKDNEKVQMIEGSHGKGCSSQRFFGIPDRKGLRYITPLECERAQTVPDFYTASVSKTQRYKMLGNGWTINVIAHILKNINK